MQSHFLNFLPLPLLLFTATPVTSHSNHEFKTVHLHFHDGKEFPYKVSFTVSDDFANKKVTCESRNSNLVSVDKMTKKAKDISLFLSTYDLPQNQKHPVKTQIFCSFQSIDPFFNTPKTLTAYTLNVVMYPPD
jgi:hypothetical protein